MFPLRMIILNGAYQVDGFFPAALAIIPMQDPGGRHSMGKAQRRADLGLWHGNFQHFGNKNTRKWGNPMEEHHISL